MFTRFLIILFILCCSNACASEYSFQRTARETKPIKTNDRDISWLTRANTHYVDVSIIQKIESETISGTKNYFGGVRISKRMLYEYNQYFKTNFNSFSCIDRSLSTRICDWYLNERLPNTMILEAIDANVLVRLATYKLGTNGCIDWCVNTWQDKNKLPKDVKRFINRYLELTKE